MPNPFDDLLYADILSTEVVYEKIFIFIIRRISFPYIHSHTRKGKDRKSMRKNIHDDTLCKKNIFRIIKKVSTGKHAKTGDK